VQIFQLLLIIVLIAPWTLAVIVPAYFAVLVIGGVVTGVIAIGAAIYLFQTRERSPEAVARRAQKIAEEANRRNAKN